jgi:6-pyruvoyl-tetrahydropterin synthase
MNYLVEIERTFRAVQGLASPIRARRGLAGIKQIEVTVKASVVFAEEQLTERGWFFDTDAAAEELKVCCTGLDARPWTEIFPFRPTFELVARHLYGRLEPRLPQLTAVEIRDRTFGVTTRYEPAR